ncbi:LOW QUALITY PROTEIN: programmed cell death protein 7 [Xyrichtys novacula]|uniref:LOW QUALITY PROTEIN: programmed cell death protein 7 n=1 Tax=Xyrichtys novacula TaxID=13765 RepID=A0AAV1EIX0_XYRNO|nr:LOW QUALITY PROTEIN: programmed cell death protein 7 [Xyrichtys novacula]
MDQTQQPPDYYGGYQQMPYPADRPPYADAAPAPTHLDPASSQWTSQQGHDGHMSGFRYDLPPPQLGGGGGGFGGPHFPPPFGFDPTVPPPPFGCPPPGHFPNMLPPNPVNPPSHSPGDSPFHTFNQQYRPAPQSARYDPVSSQSPLTPLRSNNPDRAPGPPRRAEDEASLQKSQDQQWIRRFLQSRGKTCRGMQTQQPGSVTDLQTQQPRCVPELRRALCRAAQLVSQLAQTCESLKSCMKEGSDWTQSYSGALKLKEELQDSLSVLSDSQSLAHWKTKLSQIAKRRSRRQRSRRLLQLEEEQREERSAEKEATIDRWRLLQIQQVEEKKKEQEVKRAADSVLCEVRRKQVDVKRMQDVLRSVEKLRKLRKEAASRKGIVTEPECDDAFRERVEHLKSVIKQRTVVYCAEEKALRVMLEGEQEEERRREQERKWRKERERQLQRRNRAHAILFGEDLPVDHVLQPFTQFYTQAERSLPALLHIRREWDMFVVDPDHPGSSPVPQTWVIPDTPSDQVWASALETADAD